jgi:hypothetical protein
MSQCTPSTTIIKNKIKFKKTFQIKGRKRERERREGKGRGQTILFLKRHVY